MGDTQRPIPEFDLVLNLLVERVKRLQHLRKLQAPDSTLRTEIALVREAADGLDLLLEPQGPMAPTQGRIAPVLRLDQARRRVAEPRRENAGDETPQGDRGG